MSDIQVKNKTAKFFLESSDWEYPLFTEQSKEIALALDNASSPEERKALLDMKLKSAVDGISDVIMSLSRFICFTCLSYKVEGLFKLDLIGMGKNEFRSDEEAYAFWINKHLEQIIPGKNNLRYQILHYVRANDNMDLINRCTFKRACVISKFVPEFKRLGIEIPEEVYIKAEKYDSSDPDLSDLSIELGWEVAWRDKAIFKGSKPTEEELKAWKKEYLKEKKEWRTDRMKGGTPSDPMYHELHKKLGGVVKGEIVNLRAFLNSVLDLIPAELDPSKEIFKFMHSGYYKFCLISNVPFSSHNRLEIHHLKTRGAATDRRSFNLIAITSKVHKEIDSDGLRAVLEKYEVTEEFILAQAIRVDREFMRWLEGRLLLASEPNPPLKEKQ